MENLQRDDFVNAAEVMLKPYEGKYRSLKRNEYLCWAGLVYSIIAPLLGGSQIS
jgi:hypothetical protein